MDVLEIKNWLEWLGVDYFLNPHKRVYWFFLFTSIMMAIGYLWYKQGEHWSTYLSQTIWLHPSAQIDYIFFFVIALIKSLIIFPVMLGVSDTAWYTLQLLNQIFGYHQAINLDRSIIIFLYTLLLFVVGDFTRYWLHRWLHSSELLWQFHKIHHSASVLTPFTFYRVHPLENILFGLRYALTTGMITGLFIYWFGARLQVLDIFGVNIFIFISLLLGANLRHSPVYLKFPKFLEKWLISPAQHQIHHTIDGARKNYGGVLSLWDRLFGSLHLSDDIKPSNFGLDSKDEHQFTTVHHLLFKPFVHAWAVIKK